MDLDNLEEALSVCAAARVSSTAKKLKKTSLSKKEAANEFASDQVKAIDGHIKLCTFKLMRQRLPEFKPDLRKHFESLLVLLGLHYLQSATDGFVIGYFS